MLYIVVDIRIDQVFLLIRHWHNIIFFYEMVAVLH